VLVSPLAGPAAAVDGCSSRPVYGARTLDGTVEATPVPGGGAAATEAPPEEAGRDSTGVTSDGASDGASDEPSDGASDGAGDEPTDETGNGTGDEPSDAGDEPETPTDPTDDPPGGGSDDPGDDGGEEEAALSIESAADPQVVEQGETLTITITVSNAGPGSDPGVVVSATMPEGLDVVGTPDAYDAATGLWDIGAMPAGQTVTLVLTVEVTTDEAAVTTPSVSGELSDGWVTDDQACTLVEVQPEGSGGGGHAGPLGQPGVTWEDASEPDTGATPGGSPGTSDTEPDEPTASDGQHGNGTGDSTDDDDGTGSGDSTGNGETVGSGGSGESAATVDPSASPETNDAAAARGDVPATRTTSDAATIMLGWMLLGAGVVLLLVGAVRRRTLIRWTPER